MDNNLQPVDFELLNSIANNDNDFKKELIVIFLNQIPVFIDNMKKFLSQKNLEKLAREAHTAKSSVLIFGMINTGDLLKNIQLWAENNNSSEISAALNQVEMDLNHAATALQNALKEL